MIQTANRRLHRSVRTNWVRACAGLTLGAALIGGAGCHSVRLGTQPFDQRAPHPPPAGIFEVDWQLKLVGLQLWESNPRESAQPAVDPDTGRVIVGTRDRFVRSINPEGKVEWEFRTGAPIIAGATIRDGIAYVPGGDGNMYALRIRDGSVVWQYDTDEQLATAPLVTENRAYVASQSNTLFAVDRETGKWLWQYRRDIPNGFMIHGASAPVISMGVLYIGFSDGYVVALDPETGTVQWERALSSAGNQFLDVDTTPYVDDAGRLIVASYKDGVYALNPDNGDIIWNTATAGITGALGRGEVVFTTGDNGISAVLAEDGRVLWGLQLNEREAQAPVFARGLLVVPVNQALMFVDPTTGTAQMSWDPGNGVTARPASMRSRLYVLSNNGYLYALRLRGAGG